MSATKVSLPPKENALFKRILKCYEKKLYKIGLKLCNKILNEPAFSDHAETLAMKGLILNALGRREEAYADVRRGLKKDLRSHTCWHVYGLLQRSERKYEEAIKAYRNALKHDPNNIQILRELSIVQIHIRDLRGYRDTRHQLFNLKPAQRASWIGFAMAYHLLNDYDTAYKILEAFRKTQNPRDGPSYDYENSELLLYQNTILEDSGDLEAAVKHLQENASYICDKTTYNETIAKLYLLTGQNQMAEQVYRKLIKANPDNSAYYHGLVKALGIEDNKEMKVKVYSQFVKNPSKMVLPNRMILEYTEGEEFLTHLRPYVEAALTKGAPPLFTDLRPLYKDPSKVVIIQKLVESMVVQLRDYSRYFEEEEPKSAPASALLWAYYYLAQHYNYLGNQEIGMSYIEKAIDHTPTLIELFICKAKIFKHMGDLTAAAKWMDEARELDTADRFINSKCAKYFLRANDVEQATAVCGKFTREGATPLDNLNEMQCMWFQTECALAYQRTQQWGESLKKCHEVDRHFNEIIDDQYDFHTYCLRKMTLRSYVQLLRLEDVLRSHPFYFKAARCAIEVYLHLYDNPLKNQSSDEQASTDNLSPADLKKMKNKQRKARKKLEMEQQAAKEAADKKEHHMKSKQNAAEDGENHPPPPEELLPEKLASTSDPLQEAIRFLKPLQSFSFNKIDTHLIAYEIYSRKNKPLLMLQSIKRALKTDESHPKLHQFLSNFQDYIIKRINSLPDPLPEFLRCEMKKLNSAKVFKDIKSVNRDSLNSQIGSNDKHLAGDSALSNALSDLKVGDSA